MPDVYHCPDDGHILSDCGDVWYCPVCDAHWTYAALAMWLVLDVAAELAELL